MDEQTNYNEWVAGEMQDPEFAYLFTQEHLKEANGDIEEALKTMIWSMGVTGFANFVGEKKSNISSFYHGRRNLKESTLNRYLKPFGVRIKKVLEKIAS